MLYFSNIVNILTMNNLDKTVCTRVIVNFIKHWLITLENFKKGKL